MTESAALIPARLRRPPSRAAVMHELRRLIPASAGFRQPLPFGLAALDSYLPDGGLAGGALHEVVPETEGALPCRLRLHRGDCLVPP